MKELTCIVCPNGCLLKVHKKDNQWIIEGNLCPKGRDFAINEMTNAKRTVCSTVKTTYKEIPRLPVRTDKEILKELIFPLMELINSINLNYPVHTGEVILENILGTGVNVIATLDMYNFLEEGRYE